MLFKFNHQNFTVSTHVHNQTGFVFQEVVEEPEVAADLMNEEEEADEFEDEEGEEQVGFDLL